MKKMIILSSILVSGAAVALAPASEGAPKGGTIDPNEIVCMNVSDTGSRLTRHRVCMTRAQWADSRRTTRQDAERTQGSRNPRQY
jgi:hypothetical protein